MRRVLTTEPNDAGAARDEIDEFVLDGLSGVTVQGNRRARPHRQAWFSLGSPIWIWAGLATCAAGFIFLTIAWGQVAGETEVYRQVPYVVSGGFFGLGLVLVGLAVINVVTRARDALERDRQTELLTRLLESLAGDAVRQPRGREPKA